MKSWERLAIYAVLGLVGLLLLRAHDASVRAQALAEQRADSLAAIRQHMVANEVIRSRDDSAARDSIARLVTRTRQLARSADVLSHRADSLVALDSLRPALAVKDSVIFVQSEEIEHLKTEVFLTGQRWRAADSAAFQWRTLAEGTALQLRDALKRSNPRFACVAGAGIASGLHTGAGLAVACGLRL